MAWLDTATLIIREIIGDNNSTLEYSDSRLQEVLFAAMYLVNYKGDFDYTIDITTQSITTTPTDDFITLAIFKAVAMIVCGEYRQAAKSAMSVKDGPSSIDTKGIAENKKSLCDQFTQQYDEAIAAKLANDSSSYYAIVGPFNYDGIYYSRGISDPRNGG